MKFKMTERGQALILIAFAAIGLFSFTALAVDGGRKFSDRRHAQNAADTAVLAAALAKVRGENYTVVAQQLANDNGYNNDGVTSTVEVQLCNEPDVVCQGLPAGLSAAEKGEYIKVTVKSTIPSTFARVFGTQTFTNTTEAIARAHLPGVSAAVNPPGGTVPPTDTPVPPTDTPLPTVTPVSTTVTYTSGSLFGNAALIATKGGNYNQCFLMNGGADVYTHNSGIYINCSGSQAIFMNGGAHLDMDATGQVVGCYFTNGGASYDPIACGVNGGVSQTINASTFSGVPTTQAPPTCSGNGSISGNTYYPGNFSNITINSGVNVVMNPGVYCVNGNFNLNGGATLSGPNGKVQLVLQNQSINLNGGTTIDFNDLEIYGNNASFTLNGGAIFRADRLRYFSTGNGNFIVNGNAEVTSANAYFYLHGGNIVWNGNSILNLHAPPQGDPFGGLLIHKPWSNSQQITLNGGSNIHLTGTFMVPASPVIFNGGVNFELHSQIIGYTYIANGGGDVDIYYVASENYTGSYSGTGGSNPTPMNPTSTPPSTHTPIPPTAGPTDTPTPGASIELVN